MSLIALLWYLLYLVAFLALLLVLFVVVVRAALSRRQRELERVTGPLDLTGETYRRHLKSLAEEVKDFDATEALGFDPTNTESLARFQPIKNGTLCAFAKSSKLWGCRDWDPSLSLEENVASNAQALDTFLRVGKGLHLEGFALEIRGEEHSQNVHSFGEAVRRALKVLSDLDPRQAKCMSKSYIGKKGWWFEFGNEPIFITSFSPCYPSTHSRFAFDSPRDSCWVLLQPEYSFAWRNIDDDRNLKTDWENPQSARDKIRVAFRNAGRNYIKEGEPWDPVGAHTIVRPIGMYDPELQWWKPKAE